MKKGQELSIEVLVVMVLALLLVAIWYFGQNQMKDAVEKNLDESKCTAAVNLAATAMSGHGEDTDGNIGFKVTKGSLDYEKLCCVEPGTLNKDTNEKILEIITQKMGATCALGRRLADSGYPVDTEKGFCFIKKLRVQPSTVISVSEIKSYTSGVKGKSILPCTVEVPADFPTITGETGLKFSFLTGDKVKVEVAQ